MITDLGNLLQVTNHMASNDRLTESRNQTTVAFHGTKYGYNIKISHLEHFGLLLHEAPGCLPLIYNIKHI